MNATRPTSIFVIALLHIAIGCFGVAWNAASLVTLIQGKQLAATYFTPAEQANMAAVETALAHRAPQLHIYQLVAGQLVPWLLTAMLLTAGVGLLQSRPGARTLSITYAVLSIAHKLGQTAYVVAFLGPVYKTPIFLLEVTHPGVSRGTEMLAVAAMFSMPLVLMAYPLLVLIVMYRQKVMLALSPRVEAIPDPA